MEVVSDAASRKVLIGEDPQQHLRPVKRYEREVGGGRREGRGKERGGRKIEVCREKLMVPLIVHPVGRGGICSAN